MGKKSLDRKKARQFILESRDKGKTNKEIYDELTQEYYDKKSIALLIYGTATKENISKYKIYNNILLGLIALSILAKILVVILYSIEMKQMLLLPLVFVVPLLNVFFFYQIAKYNAEIYRFCGIMALFSLIRNSTQMDSYIYIIIIVIAFSVAGLSFYLDRELFPNYSPNKIKKDSNGDYM